MAGLYTITHLGEGICICFVIHLSSLGSCKRTAIPCDGKWDAAKCENSLHFWKPVSYNDCTSHLQLKNYKGKNDPYLPQFAHIYTSSNWHGLLDSYSYPSYLWHSYMVDPKVPLFSNDASYTGGDSLPPPRPLRNGRDYGHSSYSNGWHLLSHIWWDMVFLGEKFTLYILIVVIVFISSPNSI